MVGLGSTAPSCQEATLSEKGESSCLIHWRLKHLTATQLAFNPPGMMGLFLTFHAALSERLAHTSELQPSGLHSLPQKYSAFVHLQPPKLELAKSQLILQGVTASSKKPSWTTSTPDFLSPHPSQG